MKELAEMLSDEQRAILNRAVDALGLGGKLKPKEPPKQPEKSDADSIAE